MTSSPAASAIDRQTLRRAFDARVEREARADFLLREAESRMLDRLGYIKLEPVSRILDVGCGLGDAVSSVGGRFADAAVIGLDLSLLALQAAARAHEPPRLRWWQRQRPASSGPTWICGDAHQLPVAERAIDLLWSNLVAHWFDDPDAVAREWKRVLRPGGLLMFSFLGVDTLRELADADAGGRPGARPAMRRRYPDLHDWGDVLVRAGFADPVMDVERLTLTYADPAALARDAAAIRAGLGGSDTEQADQRGSAGDARAAGLSSGGEVRQVGQLSVELVFGHAWCPLVERRGATASLEQLEQATPPGDHDATAEPRPQPVRIVRRRESPFDA